MSKNNILPENTRFARVESDGGSITIQVHQASTSTIDRPFEIGKLSSGCMVQVVRGDYARELKLICDELRNALSTIEPHTDCGLALSKYIESFETGDLQHYKQGLRSWVRDTGPHVENVFGFVEPYRDPFGIRAEFEGIAGISNAEETKSLARLVDHSSNFVRRLPWAQDAVENDGKGPFEKTSFDPPDFTSIHALTYCSSYLFEGINLPNYNDIRQDCGFKNMIIANRMSIEADPAYSSPFFQGSDGDIFQKHRYDAAYLSVVIHELLGHGTSLLLTEDQSGNFNYDPSKPPISPLTDKPVNSWYKGGETWTSVFSDLATTVDECRAELVASYLIDDLELLGLFGFTKDSEIKAEDGAYTYLDLINVD